MEKRAQEAEIFTCPFCPYSSHDVENLQDHVEDVHATVFNQETTDTQKREYGSMSASEEDEIVNCPLCCFQCKDYEILQTHVQMQHDLSTPKKDTNRSLENEELNICPVCQVSDFGSEADLQIHIDHHFNEQPAAAIASTSKYQTFDAHLKEKEAKEKLEFRKLQARFGFHENQDVESHRDNALVNAVQKSQMTIAEYHEKRIQQQISERSGLDDGSSVTNDLIQKVHELSLKNHRVKRILVCSSMDHYATTFGDEGWGCGYRNLQMLLSCLLRNQSYAVRLRSICNTVAGETNANQRVCVPSIYRLQQAIEESWKSGFDVQGCEQLGGKLYNTRKWIGATEIVALLSSHYIRCQLIDYWRPTSPNRTHSALFDWVLEYFNKQAEFKPPIYLQHQGHSRIIIGIEQLSDSSVRLLIADPGHTQKQVLRLFEPTASSNNLQLLRNPLTSLKKDQYQIVCINGFLTEEEYESCKVLRSTRIPA